MSEQMNSLLEVGKLVKEIPEYLPDKYLDVKCPTLSAMLSMTAYKGKPRATATLLIVIEEGKVKARINNRAQARLGWHTVDSCESLFEELENALVNDKIDWREDRNNGKYRG